MNQMIDLSNNIQANEWIHSVDFGLKFATYDFNHQQLTSVFRRSIHTSLVNKSHQERLSIIEGWLKTSDANNDSTAIGSFFPKTEETVIIENAYWKVLVPAAPLSQYESLIVPKLPCKQLTSLSFAQRTSLSALLGRLAIRYENLLMTSLDCEISWHRVDDADVGLFARYNPTNNKRVEAPVTDTNYQAKTQRKFANQLHLLSDIHFEDVFGA